MRHKTLVGVNSFNGTFLNHIISWIKVEIAYFCPEKHAEYELLEGKRLCTDLEEYQPLPISLPRV